MTSQNSDYPLIKLRFKDQMALFLIQQELKSRKLFQALHEVGLDDCYFQPHLDSLILRSVGLYDGTDETFGIYDEIIERRSRKIEANYDSIMKQALRAYRELKNEKKKRSAGKKSRRT